MSTATERIATIAATGMWTQLRAQQLGVAAVSISWTGLSSSNKILKLTLLIIGSVSPSNVSYRFNGDFASNYRHRELTHSGGAKYAELITGTEMYPRRISVDNGETSRYETYIAKGAAGDKAMIIMHAATGNTGGFSFNGTPGGVWDLTGDDLSRIDVLTFHPMQANSTFSLEGDQT